MNVHCTEESAQNGRMIFHNNDDRYDKNDNDDDDGDDDDDDDVDFDVDDYDPLMINHLYSINF